MNQIIAKLWLWFWRLLPANPILVRVVHGASRRSRHAWLRFAYLAILLLVVLFSLSSYMTGTNASLTELAKGASRTFAWASMTQLALMSFLAPIFTASAITQERDAQTFNILLSTPLSSAQIVFGSLMSRMYFLIMLLVAGLPIFLVTMVYGGVTTGQILESFAISCATAMITGALAIFVAMSAVGTRRTIFSFYLLIGFYLVAIYMLAMFWDRTWIEASTPNLAGQKMSWLTPLHPFLALHVALNDVYAPPESRLLSHSGMVRFALAHPSSAYVIWTTIAAFVLTVLSIFYVRRGAKTGEPTFFTMIRNKLPGTRRGQETRAPRPVWANPVAWREAKTRAATSGLIRWITAIAGFVCLLILFGYHVTGNLSAAVVRVFVGMITIVQVAVALIIATNTAATSMTKEREAKTMDVLLTTPVTSKYILWGKLRGLVTFTAPLLAGPVVMLLSFGVYGAFAAGKPPAIWIETGVELAALLTIFTALACVLGLKVSMVSKKNVTAVMYSVGILIVACGAATAVGFAIVDQAGGEMGALLAPFTPFTAIYILVDPSNLFASPADYASGATIARMSAFVGSAVAITLFAFIAWRAYAALVRDFDMTMRKQSGG